VPQYLILDILEGNRLVSHRDLELVGSNPNGYLQNWYSPNNVQRHSFHDPRLIKTSLLLCHYRGCQYRLHSCAVVKGKIRIADLNQRQTAKSSPGNSNWSQHSTSGVITPKSSTRTGSLLLLIKNLKQSFSGASIHSPFMAVVSRRTAQAWNPRKVVNANDVYVI